MLRLENKPNNGMRNMRDRELSRYWLEYQLLLLRSTDPEMVFTESLQKLLIVLDTINPRDFDIHKK